jgi:quercetin dioxygenase-like cupin family protein
LNPSRTVTVFGEPIEILISGEMTAGCSTTLIQTSPPGGGPPPHSHLNEDEVFFVLEGDYEFLAGGAWSRVASGQAVSGMRGSVHTFRNVGTTAGKVLIFVAPAGLENYFDEISPLSIPGDMAQLLAISERFGISFQL